MKETENIFDVVHSAINEEYESIYVSIKVCIELVHKLGEPRVVNCPLPL